MSLGRRGRVAASIHVGCPGLGPWCSADDSSSVAHVASLLSYVCAGNAWGGLGGGQRPRAQARVGLLAPSFPPSLPA